MSHIALYMRLSNEDIHEGESFSIENQRALLYEYMKTHHEFDGQDILEFCDDGYSGTNFHRPAVERLLALAQQGAISCILVKDLSRFGRNYIQVGTYLEQIFPSLGIRFISVNDGYDNGIPAEQSMDMAFRNLIYDLYSRDLSKKIISARRTQAARGKFVTGSAPYGYRKGPEKTLLRDEETASVVQRIFDMASEGISKTGIADALNREKIPSPAMVRRQRGEAPYKGQTGDGWKWNGSIISRILKDRRYVGDGIYGKVRPVFVGSRKDCPVPERDWVVALNSHEPLVSREQFERAGLMSRKRSFSDGPGSRHSVSGGEGKRRRSCSSAVSENLPFCFESSADNRPHRCAPGGGRLSREAETAAAGLIFTYWKILRQLFREVWEAELSRREQEMAKVQKGRVSRYRDYKRGRITKEQFMRVKEKLEEEEKELQKGLTAFQEAFQRDGIAGFSREEARLFMKKIEIKADHTMQICWNFRDFLALPPQESM